MKENVSKENLKAYDKFYKNHDYKEKEAESFSDKAWYQVKIAWKNIKNESDETKRMAEAFYKMLEYKLKLNERQVPPTEEEVKEAIQQLKDVGRIGIFASVSIMPGGALSLLGLELHAKKFGIDNFTFTPSSFRKHIEKEERIITDKN